MAYQDGYVGRFEIIVIGTHGGYIIYIPGCIMIDLQLDGLSCPEATYHLGRALIYQNPTTKTNGARRVRGMQCHCKGWLVGGIAPWLNISSQWIITICDTILSHSYFSQHVPFFSIDFSDPSGPCSSWILIALIHPPWVPHDSGFSHIVFPHERPQKPFWIVLIRALSYEHLA